MQTTSVFPIQTQEPTVTVTYEVHGTCIAEVVGIGHHSPSVHPVTYCRADGTPLMQRRPPRPDVLLRAGQAEPEPEYRVYRDAVLDYAVEVRRILSWDRKQTRFLVVGEKGDRAPTVTLVSEYPFDNEGQAVSLAKLTLAPLAKQLRDRLAAIGGR